uniref:C2H2-type domain-containing protein n=1 Tax=Ananas comosus var. bracteatus TaxID=296719 RepID=A0A6V7QWH1_ANACO
MDPTNRRPVYENSSNMVDPSGNFNPNQLYSQFDSGNLCFDSRMKQPLLEFPASFDNPTIQRIESAPFVNNQAMNWDPRAMLTNLSFLEQKIHQLQDLIRSIITDEAQFSVQPNELAAQQQLVTADLTCIIIQLISTAGTLLPSVKNTIVANSPPIQQLASIIGSTSSSGSNGASHQNKDFSSEGQTNKEYEDMLRDLSENGIEGIDPIQVEDQEVKDSEDGGADGENLPPGSYEVLQLEKEEILAPHTHFCSICGKGFKRDANLRMHMRGHGDEYKTPAALAKPTKEASSEPVLVKRYSCPFIGCKRNKEHKKFHPLKTILCVKNHYKRTHCDKRYTCSRCNTKKFSVIADLKTHEKHCGRDKWLCSCGTTFSRKDKLFGHVALFQGHTPALPSEETKVKEINKVEGVSTKSVEHQDVLDIKALDNDCEYFSPMNFDSFNFGGLDEFPRTAFDPSESSFSFLPPGSCGFDQKNGEN